MRTAHFALLAALTLAPPLAAQSAVIDLVIVDSASGSPIPGVRVSVIGVSNDGFTDDNGRFIYTRSQPGRTSFFLRRLGYAPAAFDVEAIARDTTRIRIGLRAVAQTLASVSVEDSLWSRSSSLAGYEYRRSNRIGGASYISRSDIVKRRSIRTTDLLRRIPSLRIVDSAGVTMAVSARMKKTVSRATLHGSMLILAECPLQIAVDGSFREWGFDVNSIAPDEIHGIEVYPGAATVPPEFAGVRRDSYCGAILIWTRVDK